MLFNPILANQLPRVAQAYRQLLEAVRCGFHADAVRTIQLEMENFALSRWGSLPYTAAEFVMLSNSSSH